MDSRLPSGSLNQATLVPEGDVQTLFLSWSIKSYRSKATPFSESVCTIPEISGTFQPRTVKGCGVREGTLVTLRLMPLALNSIPNLSLLIRKPQYISVK